MKLKIDVVIENNSVVTPRAGVWIETHYPMPIIQITLRHPPCGGVD